MDLAQHARAHFDAAWKTALQLWLRECFALFWPSIHAAIDWRHRPVYLDKELKALGRIQRKSQRLVDVLAHVRLLSGECAVLLLHLEVQAGHVPASFSERVMVYHFYLRQRHAGTAILSCAILLDREVGPETEVFRSDTLGCGLVFQFPVLNLAAWRSRMAELEAQAPTNPFAVVVLAQLACRATKPDAGRLASKLRLARALARWEYSLETRRSLFFVLDALLALPEALDEAFIERLETEDTTMVQYLNSVERVMLRRAQAAGRQEGLEKGLEQGLEQGLEKGLRQGEREGALGILRNLLERKFGALPEWAEVRMGQADAPTLQQWALNVLDARRLEDVF
jgi:hypothetical protein